MSKQHAQYGQRFVGMWALHPHGLFEHTTLDLVLLGWYNNLYPSWKAFYWILHVPSQPQQH